MNELLTQHQAWLDREFPGQSPLLPVYGMMEEAGELLHVLLKAEQAKLWGHEPRYPASEQRARLVDAVGDCAIFFASALNSRKWRWPETLPVPVGAETPLHCVTEMLKHASYCVTQLTSYHFECYLSYLARCAELLDLDFVTAVWTTWEVVQRRTRHVCTCGAQLTQAHITYPPKGKCDTCASCSTPSSRSSASLPASSA